MLPGLFLGRREGCLAPSEERIAFGLVEGDMVGGAATVGEAGWAEVPGETTGAAGSRCRWVAMATEDIFKASRPNAVG